MFEKQISFRKLGPIILVSLLAAALRFYNLDWDGPYSLHPDERNIAKAVMNLDFRSGDLNPNFFAYGAFPQYLIYLVSPQNLEGAVRVGRTLNAVCSVLAIPLFYFLTVALLNCLQKQVIPATTFALIAAIIAAFNPGLIQYGHFATFESILTLQYLVIAFFGMKLVQTPTWKYYLLLSLSIAMSIATKVVSLTMLPILLVADLVSRAAVERPSQNKLSHAWFLVQGSLNFKFLISFSFTLLFAFLLSPFNLIDFAAFQQSIDSERSIAEGSVVVAYTQKFLDTTPILYQYKRVLPYILGIPLTVLGTIGLLILIHESIRTFQRFFTRRIDRASASVIIFTLVPFSYAVFHFGLFVKWTRYMVPLIPFLILGGMVVLSKLPLGRRTYRFVLIVLILFSVFKGLDFFAIYLQHDPRVAAGNWLKQNMHPGSKILAENDGAIVAIQDRLPAKALVIFNFYELDGPNGEKLEAALNDQIRQCDFIVILSNRIYSGRYRLFYRFPRGKKFYENLDNRSLGFHPVVVFSRKTILEKFAVEDGKLETKSRLFSEEESFRVFDHPTVIIYKRL